MAAELGLGRRAAVISDDAVFALYGAAAEKALTDAGFQVDHFLFPHGEQQKNLSTYGQVLNFLCDRRFTRSEDVYKRQLHSTGTEHEVHIHQIFRLIAGVGFLESGKELVRTFAVFLLQEFHRFSLVMVRKAGT